jgi:hypothetical protein
MEYKTLFMPKPIFYFLFCFIYSTAFSQNFPWNAPLSMAWSTDGKTFDTPAVFQDSSGVPCVIRWKGDTLICAFQWFRAPVNAPSWDRVAVKFSYDKGLSWTQPVPIVVNGLPPNYQRPFDPTLTVFNQDSIRIYFSSSAGLPTMGLDASVNTYSAKSADGIHYNFEPNARVDEPDNRVIDPAVIFFNNAWHYAAPIGSPQEGAYHYLSPNGLNFSKVPFIGSDNAHNWTGNYMINAPGELRFYGSSPFFIWYNSSPNGGVWNGFVNTNLQGGDPSVIKLAENNYLMVYVGKPYLQTGTEADVIEQKDIRIFPNPVQNVLYLQQSDANQPVVYQIYQTNGRLVQKGQTDDGKIRLETLQPGVYLLEVRTGNKFEKERIFKFILASKGP